MTFRNAPLRAKLFVVAVIGLAVVLYVKRPPNPADQARADIEAIAKKHGVSVNDVLAIQTMAREGKRLDAAR